MQGDFTNVVPCGRCILCLKRRQQSWSFRLKEEAKRSTSSCFLTLTYEEPPLTKNNLQTLEKTDYQKFIKKLRKLLKKSKIKYYACGEYGTQTQRPHYHAIIFNLPNQLIGVNCEILTETWGHGHIQVAPCNIATINYVTKYIMKGRLETKPYIDYNTGEIIEDDRQKEFSLMSKKMGLQYLTPQMVNYHLENMVSVATLPGGQLTPLPRYFRDKIFSKEERKILNIEAQQIREMSFEKHFQSSYKKEHTWKKDQIRKQEKQVRRERQKL